MTPTALLLVVLLDGIPRADAYDPALMPRLCALRANARHWPRAVTGHTYGVTLPSVVDLLAGRRVEPVRDNGDVYRVPGGVAPPGVRVHTSWPPLCQVAGCHPERDDTHAVSAAIIDIRAGHGFVLVHMHEADGAAHLAASMQAGRDVDMGRGGYEGELRKEDAWLALLWGEASKRPGARMLVVTDHGRSATDWRGHGGDASSAEAWMVLVGAGVVAGADPAEVPLRDALSVAREASR